MPLVWWMLSGGQLHGLQRCLYFVPTPIGGAFAYLLSELLLLIFCHFSLQASSQQSAKLFTAANKTMFIFTAATSLPIQRVWSLKLYPIGNIFSHCTLWRHPLVGLQGRCSTFLVYTTCGANWSVNLSWTWWLERTAHAVIGMSWGKWGSATGKM